MPFNSENFGNSAGSFFGGLFGNSDKPYQASQDEYNKWIGKAEGVQNPYLQEGQAGSKNYQEWLAGQKDPSKFINGLMGNYQESPYAHMLQQQAMNAGNNSASASGMMGSSALMQKQMQNAVQIASGDMNSWLQNVLGINTQYGQGQNNSANRGQQSANALTNMYGQAAKDQSESAYNQQAGKQNDFWNTIGGGLGMLGSFL